MPPVGSGLASEGKRSPQVNRAVFSADIAAGTQRFHQLPFVHACSAADGAFEA